MGFFQKRKATQLLMVMVSHPGYAPEFTAAEAEKLVSQGADVNAPMPEGYSPLAHICVWGNLGVVRVLLDNGANPNGNALRGSVPLHIAAQNGYDELVKLLIERGADVNLRDNRGRTALHSAVVPNTGRGSSVLETLVSLGADPKLADKSGKTPLAEFQDTVKVLVGRPPFGNETQADRDRDDRELTNDLRRLTALFGGR